MEQNNTFLNLYKALDPKTRNVIGFSDFDTFVANEVKMYSLNDEQLSNLVRLTVHIIVGTEKKENFASKISELLQTPNDVSVAIAEIINEKIINNIDALYTKILFLDGEDLDEEEEAFIKSELRTEIRDYRDKINTQDFIAVLRGTPPVSSIEHVVTFLKQGPQSTQKAVLSNKWIEKVQEISVKYSLPEEGKKILVSEILLILMNLEEKEGLTNTLEHDLGISTILAEQLTEEVSNRILKLNEKEIANKKETVQPQRAHPLDHAPDNLPGEVVGDETTQEQPIPATDDKTDWMETPTPVKTEVASTPKTINTLPEDWLPKNPTPPQNIPKVTEIPIVRSIVRDKLNYTPKAITQPEEGTSLKPGQDPYREPIN